MTATTDAELTVAEAAALAGVSDRTVRNWINAGELPAQNTPNGRKVRKGAVVGFLREKGYAPPELETPAILPDAGPTVEVRVPPPAPDPTPPQNGHGPTLSPELINVVLQPLVVQLEKERERAERKERENLELAGRVGYLQAKVQQYEEQVKLLAAPRVDQSIDNSPDDPPAPPLVETPAPTPTVEPSRPWWRKVFN